MGPIEDEDWQGLSAAGRGSDDQYCSAFPLDGHHYVSHSVDATPIRWVDICSFCGRINSGELRDQLREAAENAVSDATIARAGLPQGELDRHPERTFLVTLQEFD